MFSTTKTINAWDKFFFEEKPTEGIALFRIIWMGLILAYFMVDLGNLQDFYGPHALISQATAREQFPSLHANVFNLFHPSYQTAYFSMGAFGVAIFCSMIGLFTRYSLIVTVILMTSFHQRSIWFLSSSEMLMRLITILLVVSPCGHSLSMDSFLGRFFPQFKRKKIWPVWALRLIQIQVSVVYLWTVWHKLQGNTWIDGTAVYYATRLEGMANFSIPFLMNSMIFLKLATWGTLIIETALGTLIWTKKYRKTVICAGVVFHLGIEYVMSIPFFEWYMMALLVNFFTPEELKAFVMRGMDYFTKEIQNSTLATGLKEKLITTLRGQHDTAN
jgi:hypothetical protein